MTCITCKTCKKCKDLYGPVKKSDLKQVPVKPVNHFYRFTSFTGHFCGMPAILGLS